LSARAFHRVLRVARTIADLSEDEVTRSSHVAEAIRFRAMTGREQDEPAARSA
jgi:magnesium chelatase family protein